MIKELQQQIENPLEAILTNQIKALLKMKTFLGAKGNFIIRVNLYTKNCITITLSGNDEFYPDGFNYFGNVTQGAKYLTYINIHPEEQNQEDIYSHVDYILNEMKEANEYEERNASSKIN